MAQECAHVLPERIFIFIRIHTNGGGREQPVRLPLYSPLYRSSTPACHCGENLKGTACVIRSALNIKVSHRDVCSQSAVGAAPTPHAEEYDRSGEIIWIDRDRRAMAQDCAWAPLVRSMRMRRRPACPVHGPWPRGAWGFGRGAEPERRGLCVREVRSTVSGETKTYTRIPQRLRDVGLSCVYSTGM